MVPGSVKHSFDHFRGYRLVFYRPIVANPTFRASRLQEERLKPTEIAYDRPSPRLKPFLSKNFGLQDCVDQPNRFMVFKEYFGELSPMHSKLAG